VQGNVNIHIAQHVEVALEEVSAIKSEWRFKRNIPQKGQFGNQGIRNVPRMKMSVMSVETYV
jgi:hypothetical protein